MKYLSLLTITALALIFQPPLVNAEVPSVSFGNLTDGDTVTSPFRVEMIVKGLSVAPAGTYQPKTGHHHLIINKGPIPSGEVVPKDATHLHFGGGETVTTLELPKGRYTLTLQFADGAHISLGAKMSSSVKITVE